MIFKDSTFSRCFGIEFEVEPTVSKVQLGDIIQNYDLEHIVVVEKPDLDACGWAESKSNSYWHVKYDSTCGPKGKGSDFGWEIATFVGMTPDHLDLFSNLAPQLSKNKVTTNNNCGLHIHVSVLESTTEEVGTILANWLKIEPILYHTFPSHRKYNEYCKPLRSKVNILKLENSTGINIYGALAPGNLDSHDNMDKRVSLNLVGYERSRIEGDNKRATLEFRLPECILDSKHVKNCALFIINFINHSKTLPANLDIVSDVDEFFEICGLGGRDVILDKNLLDLKIWFLKRLIKNSTLKKWQKNAEKKLNYITKLHN